jgi:signal peptidase II
LVISIFAKIKIVKKTQVFLLAFLILLVDQVLKIYIKTNYYMGQETVLFESLPWFRLHFVENEGMAYGWKLGGDWGKIALTVFRLVAVAFGTYYILDIIKKKYHVGYIICVTFIYAGAIGNLIDSLFYGMVFEASDPYLQNLAHGAWQQGFQGGYAGFLHGKVVDMLYMPIIEDAYFPSWFPLWGGESFMFFRPVFNIADAAISGGVFAILIFQSKFFPAVDTPKAPTQETETPAE